MFGINLKSDVTIGMYLYLANNKINCLGNNSLKTAYTSFTIHHTNLKLYKSVKKKAYKNSHIKIEIY